MSEKWKLLEAEQIELGVKAGLSRKQISLYAKHCYNFLQMQEIRTALEEHLDEFQIRAMCHPDLSHEEMEAIRRRIEKGETVRIRRSPFWWIGSALLSGFMIFMMFEGYLAAGNNLYLNLKEETAVLEKGEVFEPMKYVSSYSMNADTLRVPSEIDTSHAGRQAAVYTLRKGREELTRILIVEIKEEQDES